MSGMVPYTDRQPPTNRYRHQLIAPPRAGVCCVSAMEWLDAPPAGRARGVPGPALPAVRVYRPGDPPRAPGRGLDSSPVRGLIS